MTAPAGASRWARIEAMLAALEGRTALPPLRLTAPAPGGRVLSAPLDRTFRAQLTAYSTARGSYDWASVEDGQTGQYARELNDATDLVGKMVNLHPAFPGDGTHPAWWWFEYPRQQMPCAHQVCLTVRHLESGAPYVGAAVTIGGTPAAVPASGTTDGAGQFCFTFTPGGGGYGATIAVDNGHGGTCSKLLNVVGPFDAPCHRDVCIAVCKGRFTLAVTGPGNTGLAVPGEVGWKLGCANLCPTAGDDTGAGVFVGESPAGTYLFDYCQIDFCDPCYPKWIWYSAGPSLAVTPASFTGCGVTAFGCTDTPVSLALAPTTGYVNDHCLTCDLGCCVTPGPDYRGWTRKSLYVTVASLTLAGFNPDPADDLDGFLGTPIAVTWVGLDPIPGGTTPVDHWQSACLGATHDWYYCNSEFGHPHHQYTSARLDLYACSPDMPFPDTGKYLVTYQRFQGGCAGDPTCTAGNSDIRFLRSSYYTGLAGATGYGVGTAICAGVAAGFAAPYGSDGLNGAITN